MGVKNFVNNYEIKLHLSELISSFPRYEQFICSNMRNYLIRNSPVSPITEENAHQMYQFRFFSGPNPEVELIKEKLGFLPPIHYLHVNPSLITEFQKVLFYLDKENIDPKSFVNIKDLIKKVTLLEAKNKYEDLIKEGLVKEKFTCENELTWVELVDHQSFKREASLMKNCILNYFLSSQRGDCKIYSLRNNKNKPLATVEVRKGFIMSDKGFANTPNLFEKELTEFARKMKWEKNFPDPLISVYDEYNPFVLSFPTHLSYFFSMSLLILNLKLITLLNKAAVKLKIRSELEDND